MHTFQADCLSSPITCILLRVPLHILYTEMHVMGLYTEMHVMGLYFKVPLHAVQCKVYVMGLGVKCPPLLISALAHAKPDTELTVRVYVHFCVCGESHYMYLTPSPITSSSHFRHEQKLLSIQTPLCTARSPFIGQDISCNKSRVHSGEALRPKPGTLSAAGRCGPSCPRGGLPGVRTRPRRRRFWRFAPCPLSRFDPGAPAGQPLIPSELPAPSRPSASIGRMP